MWGVLEALKAFEVNFACGPNGFPQAEATWFNAGVSNSGQRLFLSWLKIARPGVLAMLDEHHRDFAKPVKKDTDGTR